MFKAYRDSGEQRAKDIGEWAKLVALVLAIVGFAGVYVPDLRTWW